MRFRLCLVCLMQVLFALTSMAQSEFADTTKLQNEDFSFFEENDSLRVLAVDSVAYEVYSEEKIAQEDEFQKKRNFKPNPSRSVWLAAVCPGLGQIYNRKFWKLPIVYGGVAGCIYAITWNGRYYKDYITAYKDIADTDPNTNSHLQVLPYSVDPNSAWAKDFLNQKQNYYRKYRDLSIIISVAVYALSIVDAFVDAQLSNFDVSPDLSMRVAPTLIEMDENTQVLRNTALGMQLNITF
ncbi:MAG: hypothetical protein J6U44_06395 [Paludibacteraceae bacterium]|nr:hypothetical protein [Paludibacteraceae bacterium]